MTLLYGIPNCDTVKKARSWLDTASIPYAFYDYKKLGIDRDRLAMWSGQVGWQALLNRAGTTFRKLPEADRADIDEAKALALMVAHPSLIKRPVVERDGDLLVGFKPDTFTQAFTQD